MSAHTCYQRNGSCPHPKRGCVILCIVQCSCHWPFARFHCPSSSCMWQLDSKDPRPLLAKPVRPANFLRCAQELSLNVQAWHRGIRDAWSTLASAKRRKLHAHSSPFQALHAHAAHWAAPSKGLASGQERPLEDICKVQLLSALLAIKCTTLI